MNESRKKYLIKITKKLRHIKSVYKKGRVVKFSTIETIGVLAKGGTNFDRDDMQIELMEGKFDIINNLIKNVKDYF